MTNEPTLRATPNAEPHATGYSASMSSPTGLLVPAAASIRAAYDELAHLHVDATTAREWLTEMVATIGSEREEEEVATIRATAPARPPVDTSKPSRDEWVRIHRLITVGLAVLNGRRSKLREIEDRHIATPGGRVAVNQAADRVARARLAKTVSIRNDQPEVHRETNRTVFFVPTVLDWDDQCRALAARITRDQHGTYRISGFTIL